MLDQPTVMSKEEVKQIDDMMDGAPLSPHIKDAMKKTFVKYDEAFTSIKSVTLAFFHDVYISIFLPVVLFYFPVLLIVTKVITSSFEVSMLIP